MSVVVTREDRDASAAPVASSQIAAVISMIERLAKDPTVDIDCVERMMTMLRDLRREEAERDFNIALCALQADLPQVKRDALNSHTQSKYSRLETISATVDPIIAKHGISLSFGTDSSPVPGHFRVYCDVALGAHVKRVNLDVPLDGAGSQGKSNKTPIQAMGSSISYARRYLKMMIFDILLTNEDDDGNGARDTVPDERRARPSPPTPKPSRSIQDSEPTITQDQVMTIREVLESVGCPERTFLNWLKVKRIEDIFADKFDACIEGAKSYRGHNDR